MSRQDLKNITLISFAIASIVAVLSTISAAIYYSNLDKKMLWAHVFWSEFTWGIAWVLFVPVVLILIQKFHPRKSSKLRIFIAFFLLGILVVVSHKIISYSLDYILQISFNLFDPPQPTFIEHLSHQFYPRLIQNLIIYCGIVFSLYGYQFYIITLKNEAIQTKLQSELARAKMQNLKSQLRPHFLFNTLQSISGLMFENVEKAETAISILSDLLRTSFERNDKLKITLSEEIQFVKTYSKLQELRFNDRLKIAFEIDEKTYNALVPPMIIQPFVENSIKHGLENTLTEVTIKLTATKKENQLELRVIDNGKPKPSQIKSGTGISNTQSRLSSLYDTFIFEYGPDADQGFEVRISIPFETH